MRQAGKQSDYLQFQPYRAIVAPKLLPQKARDQLSLKARTPTPIFSQKAISDSSRRRTRIIGAVLALLGLVVIAAAVLFASR